MARRMTFAILVACILLAAEGVQAQGPPPGSPGWMPPAAYGHSASGQPGIRRYGGSTAPAIPIDYATPRTAVPGVPYHGPDGLVTSRVPIQPDWNQPSPLEAILAQVLQRSTYRIEWLQWTIGPPGRKLLGAPLRSVSDPTMPFDVFDLQIPANRIGTATVPTLDPISFRDTDGIRGSIDIPTNFGAFEANVFALDQAGDSFGVPGLEPHTETISVGGLVLTVDPGTFAATSLYDDGGLSDIVELYNRGYRVDYQSDVLGTEANMVFDNAIRYGLPGGVELQPLVGFRYLLLQEQMTQTGRFEDITGAVPVLTSVVSSDTSNNLFGPTLGLRVEFQHEWFTLGVDPKITLAANGQLGRVTTERFRLAADPTTISEDNRMTFSPIAELQAYARIKMTQSIRLTVGYSLVQLFNVNRPHTNIYYNDKGPFPTPPAVVVDPGSTDLKIEGLTLGVEIVLP